MKSMVRHAVENDTGQTIYLYHGVRGEADLYDGEYFRALQDQYPDQFHYRPCLSDEQGVEGTSERACHRRGNGGLQDTLRGHVAYLCGPPPMVEASLKMLIKSGCSPETPIGRTSSTPRTRPRAGCAVH